MSLNKLIEGYVSLDQQIKNEKSKLKKWSLTRKRDGLKNKYIDEYSKSGAETRDEAKITFERRKKRLICSLTCNCDEDACTKGENINNCHWIPELTKKNPYDAEKTIKTPAKCEKINKSENMPMPYKYFEDKGVYTPKQMRQHSKMGTGPDLKITEDMREGLEMKISKTVDSRKKKAGKRRKTRKRTKRRTKKKRRRNKRKSKKNKRKSKRRR
jgi:hypothetical protein